MIELKLALDQMIRVLKNRTLPTETIPVKQAYKRTLATNAISLINLPPFDKSAMDGFAISETDSTRWEITDTIQAGDNKTCSLQPGQCIRIMTGAPVPAGTIQVIPVEFTDETASTMTITRATSARNICKKAEDISKGQTIAEKGQILDTLTLSVLISCGIEEVFVFKKPEVTIFSTGNELVTTMNQWGPGKIFDSNGPMLKTLFSEADCRIVNIQHLTDDKTETISALKNALENSQIIAFTGGVSAGKFDFIPEALDTCGLETHFTRLRVKPGKPMTFASNDQTLVFGFPGNPVSTFVMFHLFARAAILTLQSSPTSFRTLQLPVAVDWNRKKSERLEFLPVRLISESTGVSQLQPFEYHGSAHLSALCHADGFALISPGKKHVSAGDILPFWPLTVKSYCNV